jgi:hypothetical protein
MVWAAATSHLLDRSFLAAAAWFLAGSFLSFFGLIHAFVFTSAGLENNLGFGTDWPFALSYALAALFLAGCQLYSRRLARPEEPAAGELPAAEEDLGEAAGDPEAIFARVTPRQ